MPTGDIVRSESGEYVLGRPLKAGMIGLVYEATHKETQQPMAVKVPVPNLSADGYKRFWQEYNVLAALAKRMTYPRLTVPQVEKGIIEARGEEVLLLEFVPEETVFTSKLLPLLEQKEGLAGEILALEAAVQYTRLLEHLHASNYTCPDRKLADLRWKPLGDSGRLIVLDWNVVEEGEAGRANDIYMFGSLWYQLLAGRYPSANMNALDDGRWRGGKISYGTRLLVIQALEGGFADAFALRTAVQERLVILKRPAADLGREALQLYLMVVTPPRGTKPDFEQEWQALDRADLAVKMGDNLHDERDKFRNIVEKQGERLVSAVQQSFLTTRYEDGETAVQEVLAQAESLAASRQDVPLRLRIARWHTLINAGKSAIAEGYGLRQHRETLAKVVAELETGVAGNDDSRDWQDRIKRIKGLLQASGHDPEAAELTKTGNLLADFYREAKAWEQWASAEVFSNDGQYGEAVTAVVSAETFLNKMVAYRDELAEQWPNLTAQKKLYREREAAKRLRDAWESQTDLKDAIGRPAHIAYVLSTTLPALVPQLGGNYEEIKIKEEPLILLANLYRQVAYAEIYPDFWSSALQALNEAWKDEALKPLLRESASAIIRSGYQQAKKLEALRTSQADALALSIYREGLIAQKGLNQ